MRTGLTAARYIACQNTGEDVSTNKCALCTCLYQKMQPSPVLAPRNLLEGTLVLVSQKLVVWPGVPARLLSDTHARLSLKTPISANFYEHKISKSKTVLLVSTLLPGTPTAHAGSSSAAALHLPLSLPADSST